MGIKKSLFTIILTATMLFIVSFIIAPQVQAQSSEPRFYFSPQTGEFKKLCDSEVRIMIDTASYSSNAANIIVYYNPDEIEIIDSNSTLSGIQIQTGTAYEMYAENIVDPIAGTIKLTGFSISSTLHGDGQFATIRFRSKTAVLDTAFSFQFTGVGDTLDSNIADSITNNDILQSVTDSIYTFVDGRCVEDTTPPTITPITPVNFQLDFPPDGTVNVEVCDNDMGVNISTFSANINGTIHTTSNPSHVSYTISGYCYNITIDPINELKPNEANSISYSVRDNNGNLASQTIWFNVPVDIVYYETLTEYLENETVILEQLINEKIDIIEVCNQSLEACQNATCPACQTCQCNVDDIKAQLTQCLNEKETQPSVLFRQLQKYSFWIQFFCIIHIALTLLCLSKRQLYKYLKNKLIDSIIYRSSPFIYALLGGGVALTLTNMYASPEPVNVVLFIAYIGLTGIRTVTHFSDTLVESIDQSKTK